MNSQTGVLAISILMCTWASSLEATESKTESGTVLVPLALELPQPSFSGTPLVYSSPNFEEPAFTRRKPFLAPIGTINLAKGKPVTSSDPAPHFGKLSFLTDGEKDFHNEFLLELNAGVQWIQIDLGATSELYAVLVWHFHASDRVYFDVVVQISDDPTFSNKVTTFYNNDLDNSAGLGSGKDKEYVENFEGRLIDAQGAHGRYVRLYSNGNTTDDTNHYVEVEAYGKSLKD
ncbi:MAG: discoidin domain-containing protein [Candidatus Hydrogenedentes bacterium]|nr:discoidin domain-containing protein [Candidatus Hydrogenedentota bacterium]